VCHYRWFYQSGERGKVKRVAFFTTIFPMKEQYLHDFFTSLKQQTYKDFDVIIVNDGYLNFEKIKIAYGQTLSIIELLSTNTPAKNREFGINYCIDNKYDVLIFGDSDDFFETNRIEKSLQLLEEYDVVVNDLSLFDENGVYEARYFSNRLENLTQINFDFIRDKNIFGLSNTAIRLEKMHKVVFSGDLIAVDWHLFSILLMSDKRAVFTNETVTFYRQYSENLIGLKELNQQTFERGVEVKKRHYEALNSKTKDFLKETDRLSTASYNAKTKEIKHPLWWELI
jgi:glycosyltransferase involved in cell wall biosynthesis